MQCVCAPSTALTAWQSPRAARRRQTLSAQRSHSVAARLASAFRPQSRKRDTKLFVTLPCKRRLLAPEADEGCRPRKLRCFLRADSDRCDLLACRPNLRGSTSDRTSRGVLRLHACLCSWLDCVAWARPGRYGTTFVRACLANVPAASGTSLCDRHRRSPQRPACSSSRLLWRCSRPLRHR